MTDSTGGETAGAVRTLQATARAEDLAEQAGNALAATAKRKRSGTVMPKFDDYSQSFAAAMIAEEERMKRNSAELDLQQQTAIDRRDQAYAKADADFEEAGAEIAAKRADIARTRAGINSAIVALQGK